MAKFIMLRLEGLLQAWGESAVWDNRSTAVMPTKSGVVGLLGCAMGLERKSERLYELSRGIRMGIRADRRGAIILDYHTVQGMPKILNAAGKPRGDTIVTPRWYLQDASFLAVLEASESLQQQIERALEEPVWCIYLGRKNCVPSRPVWDGLHNEYEDILDAIYKYPAADRGDAVMAYEVETPCAHGSSLSRPDAVVGERMFEKRLVWRGAIRREQPCI